MSLLIGNVITNDELTQTFGCSTQGGMRRSNKTNTLVLVSNHVKSIYHDRWVDNVLHYTGMGTKGDQSLSFSQNRTLAESNFNGVTVHLFEVFEDQKYTYQGVVKLAGTPYQEEQLDSNNTARKVFVFPLVKQDGSAPIPIDREHFDAISKKVATKVSKLSDEEIAERARNAHTRAGQRQTISTSYERNPFVMRYAKIRAKGICQLCDQPAPFRTKDGEPYLETHHIEWLSKGGTDTIENTVALCPNCHRKMHIVNDKQDRLKLKEKRKSNE